MNVKIGYDFDIYMKPVWEGEIQYHESIMFFPNPLNRTIEAASLLYQPEEIWKVYSSDFGTEYQEGLDYILKDGQINRTENSRIPVWEYDDYYLKTPCEIEIPSVSARGRYVWVGESRHYAKMQIAVTYRKHPADRLSATSLPRCCINRLPRVCEKLKKGAPVTIVYYGDSIMTGCDASGKYGYAPNMPIYIELVTEALKHKYPHSKIITFNTAVGGTTSFWGIEEIEKRVSMYHPDLVFIGFGMNDSGLDMDVKAYERNNRMMVEKVRKECPNTEFLFISTTIPNPDCMGWTRWQPFYQSGLEAICKDTKGTALVRMTDLHKELLTRKRYGDMMGNGVNHPNDYLARIYAQAVAKTLGAI